MSVDCEIARRRPGSNWHERLGVLLNEAKPAISHGETPWTGRRRRLLMPVCKRVIYSGRVQGVGFRYSTRAIAENHTVTGYVRNLSNGCVEVVAEGNETEVDAFLEAVATRMAEFISARQFDLQPPLGFRDFQVRY